MDANTKTLRGNEGLRKNRKAAGYSQSQFAEKTGINKRVLEFYEQGLRDISGAKLSTLLKVCITAKCKLRDIVTDEETRKLLDEYDGIR